MDAVRELWKARAAENLVRTVASSHRNDILTASPFSHAAQGLRHDRQALAHGMKLDTSSAFDSSVPSAPPQDDPSGCDDAPGIDTTDEHKEDEVDFGGDGDVGDEPPTTEKLLTARKEIASKSGR